MRRTLFALALLGPSTLAIVAMTSAPAAAQHWHAERYNRWLAHHSIASGYPYYYGRPAFVKDDANYAASRVWLRDAIRKSQLLLTPQ
jgi:hypothetical protein